METQLTHKQEDEIRKKIIQLGFVKDGILPTQELANAITQRRLDWLRSNRGLLRTDLPLVEAAYRLLLYDPMQCGEGLSITLEGNSSLRAEARTFCPYLEACQRLGMDTRFVCKEIGEPSIQAFMKEIDSRLHFSRDYEKIRPYHDCCVEHLEVLQ